MWGVFLRHIFIIFFSVIPILPIINFQYLHRLIILGGWKYQTSKMDRVLTDLTISHQLYLIYSDTSKTVQVLMCETALIKTTVIWQNLLEWAGQRSKGLDEHQDHFEHLFDSKCIEMGKNTFTYSASFRLRQLLILIHWDCSFCAACWPGLACKRGF